MNAFASPKIYIQISPERIVVRDIETGKSAVESDTSAFRHPRSLISDFNLAAKTLNSVVTKVLPELSMLRPVFILHWRTVLDGGFSSIEVRILEELGQAATARKVYLSNHHRELSNSEILQVLR